MFAITVTILKRPSQAPERICLCMSMSDVLCFAAFGIRITRMNRITLKNVMLSPVPGSRIRSR